MFARFLIATLLTLGAAWSATPPWYWYNYTLDSTGNAAGYSKLRYDKDGKLKIAYRSGHNLMYGVFDEAAATFRVEQADTGLDSYAKIDMALDSKGNPHIIHHDATYQHLMYAYHDGTKWIRFVADTLHHPTTDFYQISLLIDSKDVKHMIYTTSVGNFNGMTYSSLDADENRLDKFVFPDLGSGGKWNSMVFDKDENPVVAYFIYAASALVVGSRSPDGAWKCGVIPPKADYPHEGFYANMKRSGDKYLIVAHNRNAEGHANGVRAIDLLTGVPGDSAWTVERIDTLIEWTQYSTQTPMILGKDGEPIVIIPKVKRKDEFNADSAYLTIHWRKDSTWQYQVMDTVGITGLYADMVPTPEGLPAVTYYEDGKHVLHLSIASSVEPKDENHNGIPDYQEKPIQFVGLNHPALLPRSALKKIRGVDALGRKAQARTHARVLLPLQAAPARNAER